MTAWMDAVATATAGLTRVQPSGSVTNKTSPYATYNASVGDGGTYALTARNGVRRGLVSVQTFGRSVDSALDLMEQITGQLLDERLVVEGWDCTPCTAAFRSPRTIRDPDDDAWIVATQAFPFTATPITEES